ncbi:MAG: DUF1203 domain-containing protein [Asticcacaulis sp.]
MFQVQPLSVSPFLPLFGVSGDALKTAGVIAQIADRTPGFPCRVSLRDAEPGERVLLLNYEHQPADTPFRASHAIYVREGVDEARLEAGELPPVFNGRTLSVRAFDAAGMMVAAELTEGTAAAPVFDALLAREDVAYLHAHFARYGCYAAKVVRT